jgi:DNA-directed RNA polymerase sigma subunit (sigma70/sigma32)
VLVARAVRRLSPRHELVLRARFGLGASSATVDELAVALHVSPTRVRELEVEGVERLRRELRDWHDGRVAARA